jgi:hypothetical protein
MQPSYYLTKREIEAIIADVEAKQRAYEMSGAALAQRLSHCSCCARPLSRLCTVPTECDECRSM